jgi:hypothetical protein
MAQALVWERFKGYFAEPDNRIIGASG